MEERAVAKDRREERSSPPRMEVEGVVELENEEDGEGEEESVGRESLQGPSHSPPAAHHSPSFRPRQAPTLTRTRTRSLSGVLMILQRIFDGGSETKLPPEIAFASSAETETFSLRL